jgi:excisionase family DNA binding protein
MDSRNVTSGPVAPIRLAYSFAELARMLPVTSAFLRREVARGRLRATRLGRRVVVLSADLNQYLEGGQRDGLA